MNREDRSEWFAKLKSEEQRSARRVEDILKQQKEQAQRRSGRRRVKWACLFSAFMIGGALLCVVFLGDLASDGKGAQQEADPARFSETISWNETKSGMEEFMQEVGQAPDDEVDLPVNAGTFYGNTVLSTAGGITLDIANLIQPEWVQVDYLTVNPFSRPCIAMDSIQYIAIHYVGNAGTTASQNRNYFEGLKDTQVTKASSHFVVGLEGEVIQCIPLNEMSYCTNERNVDTISIEVCHPDEGGQFTEATYQSVVRLTAWLCEKFSLPVENVIRHFDVTGKICPKYYVEHPEAWDTLKADIQNYINENPNIE